MNIIDGASILHGTMCRRSFLWAATGVGLAEVLSLGGCAIASTYAVVPILNATANVVLGEIVTAAKRRYKRNFSAGEYLVNEPSNDTAENRDVAMLPNFRVQGIKTAEFCTPVSIIRRGLERYLQVAAENNSNDVWSLITGGARNESVFEIHTNWLDWLLNIDNCNLRVNGNSTFGPCGVNNCQAYLDRQEFLDVNNKAVQLAFVVQSTPQHIQERHGNDWRGCPVVSGAPEQCAFGAEKSQQ